MNINLKLEEAVEKVANNEKVIEHLKLATKHTAKGLHNWVQDNPKIATALAAGTVGLALGKRLSKSNRRNING